MINDIFDYLRTKKFFNYKIILILIFCTVFLVLFLFLSIKADGSSTPKYKYYKSIEVKSGDTLWSIAEEYMSDNYSSRQAYIKEVKYINNMETDQITCGKYLIIPYYSSMVH